MVRKTVGLIVFEQMSADELAGSARAFSRATISTGDPTATGEFPCYQVLTLGLGTARCTTECGIMVKPKLDINDAPPLHTLIVPGGVGIHKSGASKKLARFLRRRAPVTGRVVTFGSGIYPLAATGMLDGKRATTHWALAERFRQKYPKVKWMPELMVTEDRGFYCGGGVHAALDLSLYLVEKFCGHEIAMQSAKALLIESSNLRIWPLTSKGRRARAPEAKPGQSLATKAAS